MNAMAPAATVAGGMPPAVSLAEATRVWARIGLLSFGGPAGQIALMHRILVEEKRWIDERRFLHALNFCMLLPGPEAQQLATYVGWLMHRVRGGLVAGTLFVLPGFVVILVLSLVYVAAGTLPLVAGLFTGLKSAVVVIVLQAILRIGRRSLDSAFAVATAVLAFVAMYAWQVPFPAVIAAAAVAAALRSRFAGPRDPARDADDRYPEAVAAPGRALRHSIVFGGLWLAPVAVLVLLLGPDHVFTNIGTFFSEMAVVTFGGAYAVLAWVSQQAVDGYGWLAPGEMLDGLAMAETTPGPLILVTQFVGFIAAWRNPGALPPELAGVLGALLTVWVTFLPCFLWIFVGAPYIERLRRNRLLSSALAGVTAAVVGVIANLALWFSVHAFFASTATLRFAGTAIEVPVLASLGTASGLITLAAAVLVFRLNASLTTTLAVTGLLGMSTSLV